MVNAKRDPILLKSIEQSPFEQRASSSGFRCVSVSAFHRVSLLEDENADHQNIHSGKQSNLVMEFRGMLLCVGSGVRPAAKRRRVASTAPSTPSTIH